MKHNRDEPQSTSRGTTMDNLSDDGSARRSNRHEGQGTSQTDSSPTDSRSTEGRAQFAGFINSSTRTQSPSLYTLDREVKSYINKRESQAFQYYPGTEMASFTYMEERTILHSTNLIESTAHLIKGSLGAGVLSMHEAYMYGGLWTSLAVTFIIGFFVTYSMLALVNSAQIMYSRLRVTMLSYADLAEVAAATGPWHQLRRYCKSFRYLVDILLFLELCGTCCIYQIMIARTFKQVLESMDSSATEWLVDIRIYILISTPPLLLLCMIRSLKFLAPFALLADIFVAMCVLTTMYYSLRPIQDTSISERPGWKNPHGFIRFCGICMYCTCGIAVALPVENHMRKPQYFPYALFYAMTIVIILTCLTGFFGYWGWGEICRSPITVHMPFTTFTAILQMFLVMMLSTTFAVQFWVPFRIIWHYIGRRSRRIRRQGLWERFLRLIMALLVTGVSITFPNLIPVMIFIGQFFLGFIAIVFPAFIEILVTWTDEEGNIIRWKLLKNFFLILFGLFLSATSFYSVKE